VGARAGGVRSREGERGNEGHHHRRRNVDPIEAAQITGHSPEVWARHYARSFGKSQRDEARDRMLEHGFGAVE